MTIQEKLQAYISLISERYEYDNFSIEGQDPIYELEADILQAYGLPTAFSISNALQERVLDDKGNPIAADALEAYLTLTATHYLQSKPLTDKAILENGKKNKTPYDDVLQYMNITTHHYCVFIYEELYCGNRITVEEALYALNQFSSVHEKAACSLLTYHNEYELSINFEALNTLYQSGFPYLDLFIQDAINKQYRTAADNKYREELFEKKGRLGNAFELYHFYVSRIECSNTSDFIFLDCIFNDRNDQWFGIVIICDKLHFDIILSSARYGTQASLVRANIENGVLLLNPKRDSTIPQIEIIGLALALQSETTDEDNEPSGYYTIQSYRHYNPSELPEYKNDVIARDGLPF